MATVIPITSLNDSNGNPIGLQEVQQGDALALTSGGTGLATIEANKILYTNAENILAPTTISDFALTLIDDATPLAAQSTLELVIGTNVQAFNQNLNAIAGLSTDTNTIPYYTSAGAASITTLSPFARTLIDDESASDMRTTLELGTSATLNAGGGANDVVQLDGSGRLPAVDARNLHNLPNSSIGEVVTGIQTAAISPPTNIWTDIPGMEVTLDSGVDFTGTGTMSTSRFLIFIDALWSSGHHAGNIGFHGGIRLLRNNTVVKEGGYALTQDASLLVTLSMHVYDQPNTAGPVTYKVQGYNNGAGGFPLEGLGLISTAVESNITAMEIIT